MKVVSIVGAVLLSLLSASAFGQGNKSLAEREATVAARKAAMAEKQREARVADEEAELDRQEAALAQGQTPQTAAQPAQQPTPAAEQAKPGWKQVKKVFSPIGRAIRNGSDKFQGQVEVTVTEVGNPTIRATTDDGVARYCNPNVLDRKVEVNGTKAKIKKDHFAECSTAAPVAVASSSASTTPTDYVTMRGNATQATTASAPASNGVTELTLAVHVGAVTARDKKNLHRAWWCAAKPGDVVGSVTWREEDFSSRQCKPYTGK